MNPVTNRPATASAHDPADRHTDQAEHRPAEDSASSRSVWGSAIIVADWILRQRKFVAGHQLIAEDPRRCGGNAPAQMVRGVVVDELGDTFGAGRRGAGSR